MKNPIIYYNHPDQDSVFAYEIIHHWKQQFSSYKFCVYKYVKAHGNTEKRWTGIGFDSTFEAIATIAKDIYSYSRFNSNRTTIESIEGKIDYALEAARSV